MGSITLAQRIASHLPACKQAGFTEPDGERLKVSRFELNAGVPVLVVDDVLTTGGTTEKTIAALEAAGATVLDRILVIANRSGQPTFKGRQIISLINLPLVKWEASECPLCAQGSEVLDMSGKDNWALLTGKA